jgi:hypothetical protein
MQYIHQQIDFHKLELQNKNYNIMPEQVNITKTIYRKVAEGQTELVSQETIQIEQPTQEEIIAQKEADLLKMYQELEQLKNNS